MSMHRSQIKAYSNATHTVSKTRQVVMLYDGVIRFLQQAREAMESKNIELRYNLLVKASKVILGLQSCLDFTQDKLIAQTLYDFYSSIDARILNLHRTNDTAMCAQLVAELKEMRNVWAALDNGEPDASASTASGSVSGEDSPVATSSDTSGKAGNPTVSALSGVAVSA